MCVQHVDAEFRPEHSGLFATALRRSSTNTDSGQMEETKLSIGILKKKNQQSIFYDNRREDWKNCNFIPFYVSMCK